ncbi:MAG TPA: HAMP domain-containing sensor histidine kinase [Amycolatopsis sp.]|nr:HAMP domain-containing sensor histidine kinase [Amycolatopsis sp.]
MTRTSGQDTRSAAQIAELVIAAAGLGKPAEGGRFLELLASARGVRSVRPAAEHDDGRFTITVRHKRFLVELACPGERQWHGVTQRQRLEALLTLIGATGTATEMLGRAGASVLEFRADGWSALTDEAARLVGPVTHPMSLVDPRDKASALRAFATARLGAGRGRTVAVRVRTADHVNRLIRAVFLNLPAPEGGWVVLMRAEDVTRAWVLEAAFREPAAPAHAACLVAGGSLLSVNEAFMESFGVSGALDERSLLRAVAARCRDPETDYRHLVSLLGARRGCTRLGLAAGAVLRVERTPLYEREIELGACWWFRPDDERDNSGHDPADSAARQNRLVATVSHEFRTPLTALLSFAEMLSDPHTGPLTGDQRSAAEVITRNAGRLLRLVDDLLLLTRIEDRPVPMRFVEVDIAELVRTAVADRTRDAKGRRVKIGCAVADGPPVHGDPARLHQVLGNVLGNALKYGPDGGRIRVTARFASGHWNIELADSGMGIPPSEIARITAGFQRGSNAVSAGIAGSGLGLAVSRELVEAHGGELVIESVLGVGTTVRIVLPAERRRTS